MGPVLSRLLRKGKKLLTVPGKSELETPVVSNDPVAKSRLQAMADSVPAWWHSIDFGHGVVTKGHKTAAIHKQELRDLQLPDLHGKSVLDIGAWDGFYSFEAERRGASRVVALDHFAWAVDPLGCRMHVKSNGAATKSQQAAPEKCYFDTLPGKIGFDTARLALNSKVETVVGDFMTIDLKELGQFDVVFFFGVLYHMPEPLTSLQRVAAMTREMAVIETAAVIVPGMEDFALCEFYETTELGGDPTNWWAPNEKALAGMIRAAGFRKAEIIAPPIPKSALARNSVFRRRLYAHAWK